MEYTKTEEYGIVIAGHGSRDAQGVAEFEQAMQLLQQRYPHKIITHGFLEFATPTIDTAIRKNVAQGSQTIVMVPGILFAASHGKNDMPIELLNMKKELPEHSFHYGGAMEIHPLLLSLFKQRIEEAERASSNKVRRIDSLLVVVGRGTTDSDVNSNVNKLARMIEEGMGFGSSYVCYSGTAKPFVKEGIATAATMGYSRLVVIPYFLFTGVLVKRIYEACDAVQKLFPALEILKASYLGVHENVADTLAEKAREAFEGKSVMNCSLCKYRVQIIGYEEEKGKVQEAHHHHVRGILAEHSHEHSHCLPPHNLAQEHHVHSHLPPSGANWTPYQPHPIEAQSFQIIAQQYDWQQTEPQHLPILQRLVHTSGDFSIVPNIFISEEAVASGIQAILKQAWIITDVTIVQSALKRSLLQQLQLKVFCGVHDPETHELAATTGITRSAAGIRRASQQLGNDLLLVIGDAPTAVMEALRLMKQEQWRPKLVIGLPVGFVGTVACKQQLKEYVAVPRITNQGYRGGSPWAAAVVNALMIQAINSLTEKLKEG